MESSNDFPTISNDSISRSSLNKKLKKRRKTAFKLVDEYIPGSSEPFCKTTGEPFKYKKNVVQCQKVQTKYNIVPIFQRKYETAKCRNHNATQTYLTWGPDASLTNIFEGLRSPVVHKQRPWTKNLKFPSY